MTKLKSLHPKIKRRRTLSTTGTRTPSRRSARRRRRPSSKRQNHSPGSSRGKTKRR